MPPATVKKLERYRHRWEQQQSVRLKLPDAPSQTKPGLLELGYHNAAGAVLTFYDSVVRAGFEFRR